MPDPKHDAPWRVRLSAAFPVLWRYLSLHPPACERIERHHGRASIQATVAWRDIEWLRAMGIEVEPLFDVFERSVQLMAQVGRGNRYAGRRGLATLGLRQRKEGV